MRVSIFAKFTGLQLRIPQSAKEGNLNVLKYAIKAGIQKVVITSSWGTLLDCALLQLRLIPRTI